MKVMPIRKQIRIQRLQNKNRMVGKTFSTLSDNQRRRIPWLGGTWFEAGKEQERMEFIAEWQAETARLLILNPNLDIIE